MAKKKAKKPATTFYRLIGTWPGAMGSVVFVTSAVSFLFLMLLELVGGETNPYVGFFHYLVLPSTGTFGLVLVAAGWWLDSRRRRAGLARADSTMSFDVRRGKVQRRVLVYMGVSSGILVFAMALGGQRAVAYSESNEFCGEFCHTVMSPEYIAYQRSPHASVHCVDCHVGSGVGHFVAAKLRGVHQVVAVLTGSYETPIPTPVADMRDAQDTCEGCHWSAYDVGEVYRDYRYFSSEGTDEVWRLQMLLKVGGGDPDSDVIRGIHWHMSASNTVEYIARDARRQDIPWVRVTDTDGNVTVYRNREEPPADDIATMGEIRRMGCIDCHNRPAHQFGSPVVLANRAMGSGRIDPTIPEIKFTALEALGADYETAAAAREGIDSHVRGFLSDLYPDEYEAQRPAVDTAIEVLQALYGSHMFPEMKARWDAHPDNTNHWSSLGCFRCHGGLHESDDGRAISSSCDTCHTVVRQGLIGEEESGWPDGLPFVHPWDYETMVEPTTCSECHDGTLGLGGQ